MRRVFTATDLDGVPEGGEVAIAEDTLVTALAAEEAERRGITLRVAAAVPQKHPSPPVPASSLDEAVAKPVTPAMPVSGSAVRGENLVAPAVPRAEVERAGLEQAGLEQAEFGDLVRVVTEEILRYLGPSSGIAPSTNLPMRRDNAGPVPVDLSDVARFIDHTLLRPEASSEDIRELCRQAAEFGFAAVCIHPWHVPLAVKSLRGTDVKVCTVVGFPLGATLPQVKIYEAEEAIKLGATEIDTVINIGALKSGQDELVELDIRGVVEAAHRGGAICKVILETSLLTREEKLRVLAACQRAGADFVKTSTGFAGAGATVEDVALMKAVVGANIGVKAAGGVRSFEDLKKMVLAGATRVGASASVKIMEQARGAAESL